MKSVWLPIVVVPVLLTACAGGGSTTSDPQQTTSSSVATEDNGTTASTSELASTYLEAVCSAGQARLVLYYMAEGHIKNTTYSAADVIAAISPAVQAAVATAEVLADPATTWPAEIADKIHTVGEKEADVSNDLDTAMSGVTAATLSKKWTAFLNRETADSGAGAAVRTYFGLGEQGDCPAGPLSEALFTALVLNLSPALASRKAEVPSLGQKACDLSSEGKDDAAVTTQLASLDLTEMEIAILTAAASTYLCPPASSSSASTAVVDVTIDHGFAAAGMLASLSGDLADIRAQYDLAVTELQSMTDKLGEGLPGVPADITTRAHAAAQRAVASMEAASDCLTDGAAGGCTGVADIAVETMNALGKEIAHLVPFGSRSADEVLELMRGTSGGASPSTNPEAATFR